MPEGVDQRISCLEQPPHKFPAGDNQRLLVKIFEYHGTSGGVMGMARMHEGLGYGVEPASRNRVARLMARHGLFGVSQRRPFRNKRTGASPDHVRNQLERDFVVLEPNTKGVTDITCVHTGEGWP